VKVAVVSSGLGHVARGIEAWARDSARALASSRLPPEADPPSADKVPSSELKDVDVKLFSGEVVNVPEVSCSIPPCLQRGSVLARFLTKAMPGFTWRWGWKSTYGWEQYTFARSLLNELKRNTIDIVHTQDPLVARMLERARKKGKTKAKVILGHGTEEPAEFLRQFDYVQHLTPWHKEDAMRRMSRTENTE
jgi:hypothetical protein